MIYTLIALLVIIVVAVLVSLSNPLRKSQEEIRGNMLKLTPVGMSMEDVLKVIESNKKWETMYVSHEHGIPQGELGKAGTPIGEKSIRAHIGEYTGKWYFDGNILHTIYIASLKEYVDVFWAFDEDSKLIEIYVVKSAAGF